MRTGVIGSGIAGLTAAILASERGDEVVLITKKSLLDSASAWAQGGIVYQGEKTGSEKKLLKDMLEAGAGMGNYEQVDFFVKNAPNILKEILINKVNVPFAKKNELHFSLTGEAAHSEKRILYSHDNTGEVIINSLIRYLEEYTQVKILTDHTLIDLINLPHHSSDPLAIYQQIRCIGGYFLNDAEQRVEKLFFDKTILATGGIGQIYLNTTNPATATGDGIAAAYRSGARIVNMEFTQFHPTSLAVKHANNFLISEALRGEGAVLVNDKNEPFMARYHSLESLAPRDIVARSIREEQLKTDRDIYLSLENTDFNFEERFPRIYQKCREFNVDLKRGIPVTPAFHFSCGGILTDKMGRTSINNLFAVGECACTGIHGANRLASTSLLEGLFYASQAVQAEVDPDWQMSEQLDKSKINDWQVKDDAQSVDSVIIKKDFQQLKLIMWNYVGIIRKQVYLETAIQEIKLLISEVEDRYRVGRLSRELIELRNAVQIALLVATSAIKNKTSSGCHYLAK